MNILNWEEIINVMHHTQFLNQLFETGKLKVSGRPFKGKNYFTMIRVIQAGSTMSMLPQDHSLRLWWRPSRNGEVRQMVCAPTGQDGAQMFKEEEPGDKGSIWERVGQTRWSPWFLPLKWSKTRWSLFFTSKTFKTKGLFLIHGNSTLNPRHVSGYLHQNVRFRTTNWMISGKITYF